MLRKLIVIIFILSAQYCLAQDRIGNPDFNNNPFNNNTNANDTSKVKKRKGTILNDSLQIIYGPHTTFYFYEKDWFNQSNRLYITDTSLVNFHRYSFIQRNENKSHNLGNLATATNPVFFEPANKIGNRTGIDVFNFIELDENNIKQFNTKSPFSSWYYAQGGEGRAFLDASLSQNINERINVGFLYRRITNRLLIGTKKDNNGDRLRHVDHQNIMLHGSGVSKNQRYKAAGFMAFYRHRLLESGGLAYDQDTLVSLDQLHELEQAALSNRLEDAEGLQQKNKIHFYHQYTLIDSTKLQLYHTFDWSTQKNSYLDVTVDTIQQLYQNFLVDTDLTQTSHEFRFNEIDNRLGIKWRNKRLFMAAYYRYKNFRAAHLPLSDEQIPFDLKAQHFLGFIGNYTINDTTQLLFEGEHLLFNDYRISATLKTKFLKAKYERSFYSPSLFEQYYYGNHFIWKNNFDNTLYDALEGTIQVPLEKHLFQPYAKVTNISNYVYYDTLAIPQQADERVTLLQVGFKMQGRLLKKFRYEGEVIYTENSNSDVFRTPRFFANFQIAFENEFFKGALPAQIGLDAHWKSAYFADAYMPITQQFYRQNRYETNNYPVIDLFLSGRIGRARVFVKGTNLLDYALSKGYFATINYMEQPTQLEFGLNWLFFD